MEERLKGKELVKTVVDSEGNIELSYSSENVQGSKLSVALTIPLFVVSCTVGSGAAVVSGLGDNAVIGFGLVLGFIAVILVTHLLTQRKEKIVIVKGQGIRFLKQELPFSSIDEVYIDGTQLQQKIGNHEVRRKVCEVKARVRGREINITRGLRDTVASEIYEKIVFQLKNR